MSGASGPFRPIGYWVKTLDATIDEVLDVELASQRLDRRDWQVLNLLTAADSLTCDETSAALAVFDRGGASVAAALQHLVATGWVVEQAQRFSLSEEGRRRWPTVSALGHRIRKRLMIGISPEEYRSTVATLQRMAHNLGGDVDSAVE